MPQSDPSNPFASSIDQLLRLYPAFAALPAELCGHVLREQTKHAEFDAGTLLFDEGAPCRGFPMLLEGEVRVARGSPQGRAIELYRLTPGELCVASTSCLFGHVPLVAHAVTVSRCDLRMLTREGFDLCTQIDAFRRFVFGVFADRLADLMQLAEAVAFQRLDQRLAAALLGHGATVSATHQTLADELGTVREIVTRLLRRFERSGWVRLGRERIDLLDAPALRALAAGAR